MTEGVDIRLSLAHKHFRGVLLRVFVLVLSLAVLMTFSTSTRAQQGTFVPTQNFVAGGTTATLLQNGKVLTTGGGAALYDPATGLFVATGGSNPPGASTATLLNNGMVLFAPESMAPNLLYDPSTGSVTPTGGTVNLILGPSATLLQNGMVLLAGGGGCIDHCITGSAELYNPGTGGFAATGNLIVPRENHSATLLNNGMVLLAGGDDVLLGGVGAGVVASAELYDPTSGTFINTGTMSTARSGQTGTLLNNGKVLIAGGIDSNVNSLTTAELYDPTSGAFTPTGSMSLARSSHVATLLKNGQVLIVGGFEGITRIGNAEIYDPATGTFTPTGSMNDPGEIRGQTIATLNDGAVLVVAGDHAELYELVGFLPTTVSFSNQLVGVASAAQSVTLTNNRSTALTITGISISGTNASDFAESDDCPGSVPPGASCTISVTFKPTATGRRTANVAVAYTGVGGGPLTVPLSGTASVPAPVVTLSAIELDYGHQGVGKTSPAQTVTLRNTGNASLNIQTVGVTGTNPGDFAITNSSTCTNNSTVAINGSCTIQVTFTPSGIGSRSASVNITDNASDSPETIFLLGSGPDGGASVSPATLTFPSQYVGTTGLPQTVIVTSTGTVAPLMVSAVGASPADFGVINNCTNPVPTPNSCTIGVFFDATAGGTRTGTLMITDNATDSPQTVTLTGSGLDFSMTPGAAASATVTAGQTASYSIAVAPAGGFAQSVALSCSGGPAGSTCAVSPSMIALSGGAAQTAMVTVTTVARGSVLPIESDWPRSNYFRTPMIVTLAGMLLMMVVASLVWRREQSLVGARVVGFVALLALGMTLTSCGAGSGGGGGGSSPLAGTYTVTVTGNFSSGVTSLTHAAKLTLVVH